jgi:hypothetical protein
MDKGFTIDCPDNVKFGQEFRISLNEMSNYTHIAIDYDNGTNIIIENQYLNCLIFNYSLIFDYKLCCHFF